jgi:hypothetical protein
VRGNINHLNIVSNNNCYRNEGGKRVFYIKIMLIELFLIP